MTLKRYFSRNWMRFILSIVLIVLVWCGHKWAIYLSLTFIMVAFELVEVGKYVDERGKK